MGWIARLFRGFRGKNKEEQEASTDYKDTVRLDSSEIKPEKSLGAEVHKWLDETQNLKGEIGTDSPSEEAEDEHTRTVPTLKESDLPDLDLPDDEDNSKS